MITGSETLTLLILGLFAFKSWVRRKDVLHPDSERRAEKVYEVLG